ncbi:MAG: PAS domain S-box protein [Bacteroidota bacterium]
MIKSDRFLASVSQNISEAIFRSNLQGLVYANRAFAEMFGFEDEEHAIREGTNSLYQKPKQRDELVEKILHEGGYENEEVGFLRKDGTEFIGLVSVVLTKDDAGAIFWDGTIRNISSSRDIVRKLLDREQMLNSINRNINEAIYRSRQEGGLVFVNEEFAKMFGYPSAEEVLSGDVHDLYKDPVDRDKIGKEIITKESINNYEVEFRRKDGSTFWGYLNSIKVQGHDGKVYFDGAIRDITREKEADELAKKQAEMQELLIYISSGLINLPIEEIDEAIELSLQGLGEFVNADRAYIFEFAEDQSSMDVFSWIGKGISSIYSEKDPEKLRNQVSQYLQNLTDSQHYCFSTIEEMNESPLKSAFRLQEVQSLANVPLKRNGNVVGCVGFDWVRKPHNVEEVDTLLLKLFADMYMNIKERSSRETELRQLFNTTIEQNQRLKDFSYITSHNFRSSVANLMGLISILEEDRTNEEFFQMVKETSLKLNLAIDSINDLLNFEKDLASLDKKECNLLQVVSDIVTLNKKTIRDKKIEVHTHIPSDLSVKVLPAYLQSVMLNLITNAIKYGITRDKRNIYVEGKMEGAFVVLSVSDEGKGIDLKRYGKKLFRLGSRFHTSKESGHGMGLYITKQQVEALGGRIEVESEVNHGTKFKVFLNAK